jgi:hypothetical protein
MHPPQLTHSYGLFLLCNYKWALFFRFPYSGMRVASTVFSTRSCFLPCQFLLQRGRSQIWLYDVAFCSWYRNSPLADLAAIQRGVDLCTAEGDLVHQLYCRTHAGVVTFWSPIELPKATRLLASSMSLLKGLPSMDSTSYLGLMLHDMHALAGYGNVFAPRRLAIDLYSH